MNDIEKQLADCRRIIAAQARELGAMDNFVDAYAAWALSDEHCGGPMFDAMVEASSKLQCMEAAFAAIHAAKGKS